MAMQLLVRLEGEPEKVLNDLVKKGVYKTKTEAVRAGIMELKRSENMREEWRALQAAAAKKKRSFKEILAALEDLEKE